MEYLNNVDNNENTNYYFTNYNNFENNDMNLNPLNNYPGMHPKYLLIIYFIGLIKLLIWFYFFTDT